MRRTITICLLVAMMTTFFPAPKANAIDPVTLAILAPIAIKVAEKGAPYIIRAVYNTGKGLMKVGEDIFHFFYLPYGLGYMCFGNMKGGMKYVIRGGIAPLQLIVHVLLLPVLMCGISLNI